jgi:hypothetical protein
VLPLAAEISAFACAASVGADALALLSAQAAHYAALADRNAPPFAQGRLRMVMIGEESTHGFDFVFDFQALSLICPRPRSDFS